MQINQQPASLCFEKNIADIIIGKTAIETSITFRLYHGSTLIVEEDYVFDASGLIYIRDLASLIGYYFSETITHQSGYDKRTGGITTFVFTINDTEASEFFTVIRSTYEIRGVTAQEFIRSRFLTRLRSKRTPAKSNEFLSFLMLNGDPAFTINYRMFCSVDGQLTDLTGVLLVVNDTEENHRIITFDASLTTLMQAALDGQSFTIEQVYEYRIWATNNNGVVFDQFSFFPDYNSYRNNKLFAFRNCFNVPEIFVATGVSTTSNRVDAGFNISGQRMRKVVHEFESLISVNSGYLQTDELDWLDDFITAGDVSVLLSENLTDAVITESDKKSNTGNELQAFTFTYRLADQNHQVFSTSISGIFDHTFDNTYQ